MSPNVTVLMRIYEVYFKLTHYIPPCSGIYVQ